MGTTIKDRQIFRDMNILVSGMGNLGVSKTVESPKIEFMTNERDGAIAIEEVIPLLKPMSMKLTLNEYNKEVYAAVGKQFRETPTFFAKNSTVQGGSNIQVLITAKGKVKVLEDKIPDRGKEVEQTLEISIEAYSLEIGGVKKVDIDFKNMIAIIDGVDYYQELRAHIQ
ncbi:MAG: phage major tail tube protein [Sulfuricurvum sp.]|nr:phage major tail tube protein [Sulfuricurvum sp.]